MPTLLIIDDEKNVRYSLEKGLREEGLTILTASTAREGIGMASEHSPDAILLDVQLPDLSGLDAIKRIREQDRKVPIVIMTAHGTAETAIEAMKRGAFDYILKPWKLVELKKLVQQALEAGRLSRVPAVIEQTAESDEESFDRIVGQSPAMQHVFKEIGRVAAQDVNVLILGESGTGKELVARAVYHHSLRSEQPFLAINCAALTDSLLESELFGHEKGAFTGADRKRIGKFEQADKGTLFLDEIGEMSSLTQAKVLRVIQDGRFERVGGNETVQTDVRLIAATNKDLEKAIEEKEFRQDLFFRLNTFTLRLPPLRKRQEDIGPLAEHFLRRERVRLGKSIEGISPATLEQLRSHDWPGNVREFENAIRYAIVHATTDTITTADLPESVRGVPAPSSQPSPTVEPSEEPSSTPEQTEHSAQETFDLYGLIHAGLDANSENLSDDIHSAVDRVLLQEVLNSVDGHQTRAAEILGISRTTLRARLQQLGMSVGKTVQSKEEE